MSKYQLSKNSGAYTVDCDEYSVSGVSLTAYVVASDLTALEDAFKGVTQLEIIDANKNVVYSTKSFNSSPTLQLMKGYGWNEDTGVAYDLVMLVFKKQSMEERISTLEKELTVTSDTSDMNINDYRKYVISKLSAKCQEAVFAGVDVETQVGKEHFSYKLEDQNNLFNALLIAVETKLPVSYHADGKDCIAYDYMDIVNIYALNQYNLNYHTTYLNVLKESLSDVSDKTVLSKVVYGQALSAEDQEKVRERIETNVAGLIAYLSKHDIQLDINKLKGGE